MPSVLSNLKIQSRSRFDDAPLRLCFFCTAQTRRIAANPSHDETVTTTVLPITARQKGPATRWMVQYRKIHVKSYRHSPTYTLLKPRPRVQPELLKLHYEDILSLAIMIILGASVVLGIYFTLCSAFSWQPDAVNTSPVIRWSVQRLTLSLSGAR